MAPTRKQRRVNHAMLSFAPGNRLFSEDHFIDAFAPYGVTRRGFRALCRALSVPMLEVGATRFVDSFSFALAMRAITRIGEPDFVFPGAKKKKPPGSATTLNAARFKRDLAAIITEVLSSRHLSTLKADRVAIRKAATEAAERMLLAGVTLRALSSQDEVSSATALKSLPPHLQDLIRATRDASS
jgi:hypothetical protein